MKNKTISADGHVFKKHRGMEYRALIVELVKLLEPKVYVEVGTQKGYTFNYIATMSLIQRAIAIDTVMQASVLNTDKTELYGMTTKDWAKKWSLEPKEFIDFLLIDADHEKKAVLQDLDIMLPFVRTGSGLIFLHDTHPNAEYLISPGYCNNAWEAARFIFKNRKYKNLEVVTFPGPYAGLSIVRKAPQHLNWRDKKK